MRLERDIFKPDGKKIQKDRTLNGGKTISNWLKNAHFSSDR